MRHSVFISYARQDAAELAQRLQRDLCERECDVWLDTSRITGGATWSSEIEAAIDGCDAVLALLTPGSFASPICRAEQLRSLRRRKTVIPLLAQAGTDIPLHLESENYRDFTRPDQYGEELRLLVQDIQADSRAPAPPSHFRATVVTAPPLPRNYVERTEMLLNLRTVLITDEPGPGIDLIAVRGMGGIGKTTLAQALSFDEVVQHAFPDGIVWTTAGKEPGYDLVTRMQEVRRALQDEPEADESELQCINQYRTVLQDKAALVIVDDVWHIKDIEPFLASAPRSRLVFTTRDAGIAAAAGAQEFAADLLTPEQSRTLLARSAGLDAKSLPLQAGDLIHECGRLPLALSMIGAMLRGKPAPYWMHVLDLLRHADLAKIRAQLPGYPHPSLFRAIQVSVEELDPVAREQYLALAVLLDDMAAAPALQRALWNLDDGDALAASEQFVGLSLAQREASGGGIRLHDLQLDFVRAQHPDQPVLDLIHDAIRLSSATIERDARQFASQVVGRLLPHESSPPVAQFIAGLVAAAPKPWLRPTRPALHPPGTGLVRTMEGHAFLVNAVAVTPDGRLAVSAASDDTVRVWDLETGRQLRTLAGHASSVRAVAVTRDGRRAVSASGDATLKVWDLDTGAELHTLAGHSGVVNGVAVTADGRQAVSASSDQTLKVWDLERGVEVRTFHGHSSSVYGVAVVPGGRRAISASKDATMKLWDMELGEALATFTGHSDFVSAVAACPDSKRAVTASWDRTLKVWDLETGRVLHTLTGHSSVVNGVAVSPDGRRAVSASYDKSLKLWDLESGTVIRTLAGHGDVVNGVALTPDGRRAVSASDDQTIKLWDLEAGLDLRTPEGHAAAVAGLAVSRDGRRAVSASDDRTLKVWDAQTGLEQLVLRGHVAPIRAVAVSADGRHAVSACHDDTLKLWDLDSGCELMTLKGHSAAVDGVAVSPDGGRIVSASNDQTLIVWQWDTGQVLARLAGHSAPVRDVAITPDGRRAVSASNDQTLKVWDLEDGREMLVLEGHTDAVEGAAVSPDGARVVSASSDGTLKIWDLWTGRELRTLAGQDGSVHGAAVSPDGRFAASAFDDHSVQVWTLESGAPLTAFTCDAPALSCAFIDRRRLIAGDASGKVHFLSLELDRDE